MASKKAKMARTVSIDEITVPDEYGHPTCAREFYDSASRIGLHCMTWKEAWNFLKNGVPVKRVAWMGYWAMEHGKLAMHCKDGTLVTLDKCDEPFTLDAAPRGGVDGLLELGARRARLDLHCLDSCHVVCSLLVCC